MNQPILVVHPDTTIRQDIAQHLEKLGYFVIQAQNKNDAYDAICSAVFDVVIIANDLSGYPGYMLSRRIRHFSTDTKILLWTGKSQLPESIEKIKSDQQINHICSPECTTEKVCTIAAEMAGEITPFTQIPAPSVSLRRQQQEEETEADRDRRAAEAHLLELARDYQTKLPKELIQLKETLQAANQDPGNEEIIDNIRRQTHTLHGTAGTLGFHEVSEIAKKINDKIKSINSPQGSSKNEWQQLFLLIERALSVPERSSLVPQNPVHAGGIGTLLVVDSDARALREIEETGKGCFVSIITAQTKEQAVLKTVRTPVDGAIIALDMNTQEQPFELAHELRSLEGQSQLSIAFMSKDGSLVNRVAAASAGATQFLHKPVVADELVEVARDFAIASQKTNAKILLIDDDEYFRRHISSILETERMEITELADPNRVLETLEFFSPDLVLLDVQMPNISGWDVCRLIRSIPRWKNLPILFLTGESTPSARVECFRAGGDDYIQKPCFKEELLARIGVRLERIRLFNERADKDPLTHLLNRRAFLEQFKVRMSESRRFERPLSFCVLDLDKFKHINDTYGHLAGDQVLNATGKLISSRFRTIDIRGRWGGEEFAIAFYNEDASTAQKLLSRVLESLRKMTFQGEGNQEFHVSFSAGVATFPGDGDNFDDLFKTADMCLYKAKEAGRNRIYTTSDI